MELDELDIEERLYGDDEMLDLLESDPITACTIVWASCLQLTREAEETQPDLHDLDEDYKNSYIIAKAFDLMVQGIKRAQDQAEMEAEFDGSIPTGGIVH